MFAKIFRSVAKVGAVAVAGYVIEQLAGKAKTRVSPGREEPAGDATHGDAIRGDAIHEDAIHEDAIHEESDRSAQHAPDGSSVVEEWGEESFPASDAPQSW